MRSSDNSIIFFLFHKEIREIRKIFFIEKKNNTSENERATRQIRTDTGEEEQNRPIFHQQGVALVTQFG